MARQPRLVARSSPALIFTASRVYWQIILRLYPIKPGNYCTFPGLSRQFFNFARHSERFAKCLMDFVDAKYSLLPMSLLMVAVQLVAECWRCVWVEPGNDVQNIFQGES